MINLHCGLEKMPRKIEKLERMETFLSSFFILINIFLKVDFLTKS